MDTLIPCSASHIVPAPMEWWQNWWSKPDIEYSFCEYMEDALHHPAWGYYSDGRVRFGRQRDAPLDVELRGGVGRLLAAARRHALDALRLLLRRARQPLRDAR